MDGGEGRRLIDGGQRPEEKTPLDCQSEKHRCAAKLLSPRRLYMPPDYAAPKGVLTVEGLWSIKGPVRDLLP